MLLLRGLTVPEYAFIELDLITAGLLLLLLVLAAVFDAGALADFVLAVDEFGVVFVVSLAFAPVADAGGSAAKAVCTAANKSKLSVHKHEIWTDL